MTQIKPDSYNALTMDLSGLDGGLEPMGPKSSQDKSPNSPSIQAAGTVGDGRMTPTPEQRRAVEAAQNKNRQGRGKKRDIISVRFDAERELAEAIKDIHYQLGRTLNDLYNEALRMCIKKYVGKKLSR